MKHTYYVTCGELYHYTTGDQLRPATASEERASERAAQYDGGAGVIDDSDLSRPVSSRKLEAIERKLLNSPRN